jgi:hypothetical protein
MLAEDTELEDSVAEASSDLKAHGVAENGTSDRDGRHRSQGHLMLVGEHSAEQNCGFARQHETNEQRRLTEGQSAHQSVRGGPVQREDLVDDPAQGAHGPAGVVFTPRLLDCPV